MISHLPGNSRVWFFGAHRNLTDLEVNQLREQLTNFVGDWKAHGAALNAGFEIIHNVAVIIAVDESQASPSGCSIDKAFKLLQQSEIDFFQRTLIWQPFCNTSKVWDIPTATHAYQLHQIDGHTQILNSLVTTLNDARENLYIPLSQSWAMAKLSS
jgi:hypothetical protein